MSQNNHVLDKIVIVFENLETIEIPIQYIKSLRIDNVKTIETYDYDSSITRQDPIHKIKKADYVELIIDYDYLNDKTSDSVTLFSAERLITGRDITDVELYFKNTNKFDSISVPWMSTHGGD